MVCSVIIPAIYGLNHLRLHSTEIARDPTLHSTPFMIANQVGLWVSMWCRFLEIAHGLRDEMGHATFGFGEQFSQGKSQRPSNYYGSEPKQKPATYASSRRKKGEDEEDEIELAPKKSAVHNTKVASDGSHLEPWGVDGIVQHRSYRVESEEMSI